MVGGFALALSQVTWPMTFVRTDEGYMWGPTKLFCACACLSSRESGHYNHGTAKNSILEGLQVRILSLVD